MNRFIRWQGIISFVVISALIALSVYIFAESLVKKGIISAGEATFGAEVNIDDVKISYSPMQVTLLNLQVTDSELPTHNLFSFKSASAGVDLWQYLFGHLIINQLEVDQLEFSQQRKKSGQVFLTSKEKESQNSKESAFP